MQSGETVFGRERLGRLAKQPAVHFVLLGGLLFLASTMHEPTSDAAITAVTTIGDRSPIEIPSARIAEAEQRFRAERRRAPNTEEEAELLESLIDDEVLFRHALHLGLHQSPVAQRRLAQIAGFVGPDTFSNTGLDSDAGETTKAEKETGGVGSAEACAGDPDLAALDPATVELAQKAIELGLHEGDFVTRRVLIDAARRLVRGAGRLIEPSEQDVTEYLAAHRERFRTEVHVRVSHVSASTHRHADPTAVAAAWLEDLRRQTGMDPDLDPVTLGDAGLVPPHLPLLGLRALERRFGVEFARRLAELPVGEWTGPVSSRHGAHLVFVHEYQSGDVPAVEAVADEIRALLREQAADRWLAARLTQLRDGRTIQVGEPSEVTS